MPRTNVQKLSSLTPSPLNVQWTLIKRETSEVCRRHMQIVISTSDPTLLLNQLGSNIEHVGGFPNSEKR